MCDRCLRAGEELVIPKKKWVTSNLKHRNSVDNGELYLNFKPVDLYLFSWIDTISNKFVNSWNIVYHFRFIGRSKF